MLLEKSDTIYIQNPKLTDLELAFQSFGTDLDDFIILSHDNFNYLQVAIGEEMDAGFIVEYQSGSLEKHFEIDELEIDENKIFDIFSSYLEGSTYWDQDIKWKKMELKTDEE